MADEDKPKSIDVLRETKIRLGTAAVIVVVLVGQAVMFERRITTLTDTALSSNQRLEKIETNQGGVQTELVNVRLAIEKLDGRHSGEVALLNAAVEQLSQRIKAIEDDAGKAAMATIKAQLTAIDERIDRLEKGNR